MKKKFKISLLLSLMTLVVLFVFGGCKFGETKDEIRDKYNLTAQVTYYINGYNKIDEDTVEIANFMPSKLKVVDMYYPAGVPPYEIQEGVGKVNVAFDKYVFQGWYEVECDENGNPIPASDYQDEKGDTYHLYTLTKPAEFTPLQEGEHRHYAAKWASDTHVNVQIVLQGETEGSLPIDKDRVPTDYQYGPLQGKDSVPNGEVVLKYPYTNGSFKQISDDLIPIKDNAYTFVGYFADAECKTAVSWPLMQKDTDDVIYAQYIKGDWEIVKTAKDVSDMFNELDSNKHFFLLSDIDCTGKTAKAAKEVACEIQGNGYTLKNLTVTKGMEDKRTSIFGDIKESAVINDLHFENTVFQCRFGKNEDRNSYYFVFTSMQANAKITNVSFNGAIMKMYNYNREDIPLANLQDTVNVLFGGYETDAAYFTQTENQGFLFKKGVVVETNLKWSFV